MKESCTSVLVDTTTILTVNLPHQKEAPVSVVWSWLFLAVYSLYMFFLVGAGLYTKSLLLLSTAIHTFSDLFSYSVGLWLQFIARKPPNIKRPYGFVRAEVVGGTMCAVFLMVSSIFLTIEAVNRLSFSDLHTPASPETTALIVMGGAGLFVNFICAVLMFKSSGHGHSHGGHGHSHGGGHHHVEEAGDEHDTTHNHHERHDLTKEEAHSQCKHKKAREKNFTHNVRGMLVHIFTDFMGAIIVLVIGLVAKYYRSDFTKYADPVGSIIIAGSAVLLAAPILKESVLLMMQAPPPGVDMLELLKQVQAIRAVIRVKELHQWVLGDAAGTSMGRCTVVVSDAAIRTKDSDKYRSALLTQHNEIVSEIKRIMGKSTITNVQIEYQM